MEFAERGVLGIVLASLGWWVCLLIGFVLFIRQRATRHVASSGAVRPGTDRIEVSDRGMRVRFEERVPVWPLLAVLFGPPLLLVLLLFRA